MKRLILPLSLVAFSCVLTFGFEISQTQAQNRHQNNYGLGMDLGWYCSYKYGNSAKLVLQENNAYGWKCEVDRQDLSIDVNDVCKTIYGATAQPRLANLSDKDSWYCWSFQLSTGQVPQREELINKVWWFGRPDGGANTTQMRLLSDGRIVGYSHPNEKRWAIEGNALVFYGADGKPTTRFNNFRREKGRLIISGPFLLDDRTHILRENGSTVSTQGIPTGSSQATSVNSQASIVKSKPNTLSFRSTNGCNQLAQLGMNQGKQYLESVKISAKISEQCSPIATAYYTPDGNNATILFLESKETLTLEGLRGEVWKVTYIDKSGNQTIEWVNVQEQANRTTQNQAREVCSSLGIKSFNKTSQPMLLARKTVYVDTCQEWYSYCQKVKKLADNAENGGARRIAEKIANSPLVKITSPYLKKRIKGVEKAVDLFEFIFEPVITYFAFMDGKECFLRFGLVGGMAEKAIQNEYPNEATFLKAAEANRQKGEAKCRAERQAPVEDQPQRQQTPRQQPNAEPSTEQPVCLPCQARRDRHGVQLSCSDPLYGLKYNGLGSKIEWCECQHRYLIQGRFRCPIPQPLPKF